MKRLLSAVLILAIAITLSSCGKPAKTSDAMYQIGTNALNTVDDYISGKITGAEASSRIKEFEAQAKAQVDQECKDVGKDFLFGTELSNDESIESRLTSLLLSVNGAYAEISAMSEVQEARDKLAQSLGK